MATAKINHGTQSPGKAWTCMQFEDAKTRKEKARWLFMGLPQLCEQFIHTTSPRPPPPALSVSSRKVKNAAMPTHPGSAPIWWVFEGVVYDVLARRNERKVVAIRV